MSDTPYEAPTPPPEPGPIIRWPGGKRYLLPVLGALLAAFPCRDYHYVEPMVGGGAVFFRLGHRFRSRIIGDASPELMNLYQVVRDGLPKLVREIAGGGYSFIRREHLPSRANYERIRDWAPTPPVQRAARTLFLAKTCFNGLYRVNARGRFNVAPGDRVRPKLCDYHALHAASVALRSATLVRRDAAKLITRLPRKGRIFLFVDPPYHGGAPGKFTGFCGPFGEPEQAALLEVLLGSGHRFIYTNKATPFILGLLADTGVDLRIYPLRHSIQQRYTQGRTELEVVAYRL